MRSPSVICWPLRSFCLRAFIPSTSACICCWFIGLRLLGFGGDRAPTRPESRNASHNLRWDATREARRKPCRHFQRSIPGENDAHTILVMISIPYGETQALGDLVHLQLAFPGIRIVSAKDSAHCGSWGAGTAHSGNFSNRA